jgi:hypothetical protein
VRRAAVDAAFAGRRATSRADLLRDESGLDDGRATLLVAVHALGRDDRGGDHGEGPAASKLIYVKTQ